MELTQDKIKSIMPDANILIWTTPLNKALDRFKINNKYRIASFIAQAAHESNELNNIVENLNYTAARLIKIWPKRFPTIEAAKEYEKNPEKLGNYIYASRLGNGDVKSKDGFSFRGRGIFQITGRNNYREIGDALNLKLELHPELLEEPINACLSAAYFWKVNGLNELADDIKNVDENFVKISVRINGGKIGLEERKEYFKKAKKVLGI